MTTTSRGSKRSIAKDGSRQRIIGDKPLRFSYPDVDSLCGYAKHIHDIKRVFPHVRVPFQEYADIVVSHVNDQSRRGRLITTFWESDRLPKSHVNNLNTNYQAVAVTADSVIESFRRSGVKTPIYKFPLAIDYVVEPLPPFSPFVFISCGTDSGYPERKRIPDIVQAFVEEFKNEDDVRLMVKRNPNCVAIPQFDSRVIVVREKLQDIRVFLRRGHCGIFPSGMEGWGYPAHELMAMGRPSIAPLVFGFKEFLTPQTTFAAPYEIQPVPNDEFFYGLGHAPFMTVQHIRGMMRYVYENREEVAIKSGACVAQSRNFRFAQMQAALINIWQQVLSKTS